MYKPKGTSSNACLLDLSPQRRLEIYVKAESSKLIVLPVNFKVYILIQ